MAVRLQLLAFAWKLYLSVLRTDYVTSEGWSHQLSMNWCCWRRYKKLVSAVVQRQVTFLWCLFHGSAQLAALCGISGHVLLIPKVSSPVLLISGLSHNDYGATFPPSGLVLSFVHCHLCGLTRNLRTVKFPTQGLQSTFVLAQRHQQKFIKTFLCGLVRCFRKG